MTANHAAPNPVLVGLKNLWGEPVMFWAAVQALLVMLNAFGWLTWAGIHGQNDMALVYAVVAALAAVHLALFTHHTLLAPLAQLLQAIAALLVIYGYHISTEQTATVVALITAIAAGYHRTQTGPIPKGSLAL